MARIALPKDYVRLRLCGEHATDVSDASGTLLLDVAAAQLERRGARRRSSSIPRSCPRVLEGPPVSGETSRGVPVAAGGGRPGGRRARRRRARARAAVGRARAPRGSCSPPASTSPPIPRARAHAFCHAVPGRLARDGRDALRGRARCAGCTTRLAARCRATTSCSRGAQRWEPGVEGLLFAPYLAASAPRTPTPTRAAAFVGLWPAPRPRGARARGARRASPSVCATAWTWCRAWVAAPESARVSGGGTRSGLWLEIVASVLELPLERVAVDAGAAFGAALLGGVAAGVYGDCAEAVTQAVRSDRAASSRCPSWVAVVPRRRASATADAVPGPASAAWRDRRRCPAERRCAGASVHRQDQRQVPRAGQAAAERPRSSAVASRDGERARAYAGRARHPARVWQLRGAARRRRDRGASTSRCPTRCTCPGRCARWRQASTCCARSRSRAGARTPPRVVRAAGNAGLLVSEAFMYRHHPQIVRAARADRRAARSGRCARSGRTSASTSTDAGNVRLGGRAGRRRAHGRRLLLRQRDAADGRRAGAGHRGGDDGGDGVDMRFAGVMRLPGRRARPLRLRL